MYVRLSITAIWPTTKVLHYVVYHIVCYLLLTIDHDIYVQWAGLRTEVRYNTVMYERYLFSKSMKLIYLDLKWGSVFVSVKDWSSSMRWRSSLRVGDLIGIVSETASVDIISIWGLEKWDPEEIEYFLTSDAWYTNWRIIKTALVVSPL